MARPHPPATNSPPDGSTHMAASHLGSQWAVNLLHRPSSFLWSASHPNSVGVCVCVCVCVCGLNVSAADCRGRTAPPASPAGWSTPPARCANCPRRPADNPRGVGQHDAVGATPAVGEVFLDLPLSFTAFPRPLRCLSSTSSLPFLDLFAVVLPGHRRGSAKPRASRPSPSLSRTRSAARSFGSPRPAPCARGPADSGPGESN